MTSAHAFLQMLSGGNTESKSLIDRLGIGMGETPLGNLDALPFTLKDLIHTHMERGGLIAGRALYAFKQPSLVRPLTQQEKEEEDEKKRRFNEYIAQKLREYEILFKQTAIKVITAQQATYQIIQYLRYIEEKFKNSGTAESKILTEQAQAAREDMEEFHVTLSQAQDRMSNSPMPEEKDLHEIDETIDNKIKSNTLLRHAFRNGFENAENRIHSAFKSFFNKTSVQAKDNTPPPEDDVPPDIPASALSEPSADKKEQNKSPVTSTSAFDRFMDEQNSSPSAAPSARADNNTKADDEDEDEEEKIHPPQP